MSVVVLIYRISTIFGLCYCQFIFFAYLYSKIEIMIAHKDYESNSKRIAKYIMKQARNPQSEQFEGMIDFGVVIVHVSEKLIGDFIAVGKAKYQKEINKHLKGCSVKYDSYSYAHRCIRFNIEFDDVDPEMEDW